MTEFVIWFAVGIGAYLAGLGIFTLVKKVKAKKKAQKEVVPDETSGQDETKAD